MAPFPTDAMYRSGAAKHKLNPSLCDQLGVPEGGVALAGYEGTSCSTSDMSDASSRSGMIC